MEMWVPHGDETVIMKHQDGTGCTLGALPAALQMQLLESPSPITYHGHIVRQPKAQAWDKVLHLSAKRLNTYIQF